MATYYVNMNAQDNGDQGVHKEGCSWMPSEENRLFLGDFRTCHEAVRAAKEHYSQVNGCYHCSRGCHTQ